MAFHGCNVFELIFAMSAAQYIGLSADFLCACFCSVEDGVSTGAGSETLRTWVRYSGEHLTHEHYCLEAHGDEIHETNCIIHRYGVARLNRG